MGVKEDIKKVISNIEKMIVGKEKVVELVAVALISGGHILLEDVPGVGKTTLAKALSASIDCGFTRIQFTPDTLPSDVTGMSIYNMSTGTFEFVKGQIMNNIVLADEINRTSPKTQASLLEAMEEGQVSVDGNTYKLPQPFMVIATKNPVEHIGTYNLPEAQLDRFMLRISVGYPEMEDEINMARHFLDNMAVDKLQAIVDGDTIMKAREEVTNIQINKDIIEYIVKLMDKTRHESEISLGASPRATLSLIRACQGYAYIQGRDYVIPEDVKYMLPHVLGHRLILSSEAKMNGYDMRDVLVKVLENVPVPVLP